MYKEADIDIKKTKQWLKSIGLEAKVEALITAKEEMSLALPVLQSYIASSRTGGTHNARYLW